MLRLLVVTTCVLISACASAPAPSCPMYYRPAVQRPFLWRVTAPQGSLVVFATHQAVSGDDVPRTAWAELERAQLFVGDADAIPDSQSTRDRSDWNEAFYLPRGTSLQKLLLEDDYVELRSRIGGPVNNYKPWVAMLKLAAAAYSFPRPSAQTALVEHARERRMPVEFLETWQEQVAYLDEAVTPAKLTGMIRDYPQLGCVMRNRVEAFRAGDDAVFANEIANANEPIVPRIERWHVRLEEYLGAGRHAFVAIGIGQLVGPYGLLQRFAERGYSVQRL